VSSGNGKIARPSPPPLDVASIFDGKNVCLIGATGFVGKVAYLGSANLTVRSMTQDWEMGVVTDDPAFVGEVQRRLLDVDRRRSRAAGSLWAPVRYLGYGLSLFFGTLLRPT